MAKQTTLEWVIKLQEIERKGYGSIAMNCDGYNVSFGMARIKNKLVFVYYIDSLFKGEYINTESPIGQKFGVAKYYRLSSKYYNLLIKLEGKKFANAEKKKAAQTVLNYSFYHPSAASVIRTLKRTCHEIKLVEE